MNSCSFEESSGGNRSWSDRLTRGGDFVAIGKLSDLGLITIKGDLIAIRCSRNDRF